MRLIVITPSRTSENEHHLLKQMFKLGLTTLHVRKPHYSTKKLRDYLDVFSKEQQKCIIIHSHHRLLCDYDLMGIHFTKMHKKSKIRKWITEKIIGLKRKEYIKSTSANSISAMINDYSMYDYTMLSPVFGETTDKMPAYSPGTLEVMIRKYPEKVIARGGANLDSIIKARDLGFKGIAFQNFLWKKTDPLEQFRSIINRFNKLGIKIE